MEKEVDEKYYLSEEQLNKLEWKKGAKIVNDDSRTNTHHTKRRQPKPGEVTCLELANELDD